MCPLRSMIKLFNKADVLWSLLNIQKTITTPICKERSSDSLIPHAHQIQQRGLLSYTKNCLTLTRPCYSDKNLTKAKEEEEPCSEVPPQYDEADKGGECTEWFSGYFPNLMPNHRVCTGPAYKIYFSQFTGRIKLSQHFILTDLTHLPTWCRFTQP